MTTHATVLAYLFIHIGLILAVTAYFTVGALLTPRLTRRARERLAARPWVPLLVGVVLSVPWAGGGIMMLAVPHATVKFAGAALLGSWVLIGLIGGAALAQHVGGTPIDDARATWSTTARGGLVLSLTWALPVVGWLVALPLTLATGIGCLVTGAFPVRRAQLAPAA